MATKIRTRAFPDSLSLDGWFIPTDYVAMRRPFREALQARYLRDLAPGAAVLDLNAGTQGLGPELAARGCRYRALEPNPDIRRALAEGGLDAVDWRPPRMPVAGESQDLVLSLAFLEHLPTWVAALEQMLEIRRVLRPGGRLLVVAPNAAAMGGTFWDDYKHGWFTTPKRLGDMAEEVGLEVVSTRYTLGWTLLLTGASGALVGAGARLTNAVLNLGLVARPLDAVGLGRLSARVRKTIFELFVLEVRKPHAHH